MAPAAWATGAYQGEAGSGGSGRLFVHDVEGALYAIWLAETGARVWIVDDQAEARDDVAVWTVAGVPGTPAVAVLPALQVTDAIAVFVDASDALVTLRRTATGGLVVSEAGTAAPLVTGELARIDAAPAPALEAADRAFAAASRARGAEAWAETAAEGGAMYRKAGLVRGRDAIREAMTATLARVQIAWEPVASGVDDARGLGFTVGRARYLGPGNEPAGAGSYVTIWQRQPDGAWRWLFDTGRPR